MNQKLRKVISTVVVVLMFGAFAVGCSSAETASSTTLTTTTSAESVVATNGSARIDTTDLFSDRDLEQTADTSGAKSIKVVSNQDMTIDTEGVYVLSGTATNVTIIVDVDDSEKVQLVLDSVDITNTDAPVVYVESADKVFVTTTDSDNHMEVTGTYVADGDTNLDAVIFSKSDLTLNGRGALEIISAEGNGVSSKDHLKITGGVYIVQSGEDALEANASILINDGTFTIEAGKDALHAETDDAALGYIVIMGGTLNISATDDGIQGNSRVQIDGGTINITTCMEGIESTFVQINDGDITIAANDDGINAAQKVSGEVAIEVNGGTISVTMASGDTDGFDANGTITINGGIISIEGNSAFDSDGGATLNGGSVTVNGEVITEIVETGPRGGGNPGGGGNPPNAGGPGEGGMHQRPDNGDGTSSATAIGTDR